MTVLTFDSSDGLKTTTGILLARLFTVQQGPYTNLTVVAASANRDAHSAGAYKNALMIKAQYRADALLTKIRSQQSQG